MLVNLNSILPKARRGKYAVGAFNINNLEIAQAIIDAAVELKSPVILQTSEGAINYAGMDYLAMIAHVAAESSNVPVVFHLDHGKNYDLVMTAINSGLYSSVMYDGSHHPLKENIKLTKQIVKAAHKKEMTVEAELGRIFGKEDNVSVEEKEVAFTDPREAAEFVEETGCDALAVSIGTAHGANKFKRKPKLDIKRLEAIKKKVKVPLVLHGASAVSKIALTRLHKQCKRMKDCGRLEDAIGVPDGQTKKAIAAGISKINVDTDLRIAFTVAVRETLLNDHNVFDPRKIIGPARDLMTKTVKDKMKLLGCAGKG
ncbi:MAG: fructose-1,6-bisphosphate aldolase, class II [Parcubacteria group bacterium]|nr:fructose-1,6-bisphosphate aldolase, class II [Parcubacteria group bacterium]|tara:strand:+ start:667 stop:1608 length:942 start_codon:yes stop_codon:yes gene_type:complete